jgi:ABC-type bacteriocin/lantibiotic exporter with double-glycine peptidase domain
MKDFFNFLNQFDKFNYYLIIFFGIISAIIEVLGLGMLFPLFSILLGEKDSKIILYLKNNFFESINNQEILLYIIIAIGLIYIIKFFINLIITYINNSIRQNIKIQVQKKILEKFFYRKYLDHGKDNIAIQIKTVISEAESALIVIETFFLFIIETLILSAIAVFLIINFSKISLIMFFVFGTLFILYLFVFDKKIKLYGNKRISEENFVYKNIHESLSIFREIKFYNKEEFFLNKIFKNLNVLKTITIFNKLLNSLTRNFLELFIVLILLTSLYYSKYILNYDNSLIISTLGIFLAATIRSFPSISKIFQYHQNISFRSRSTKLISKIYNEKTENKKTNVNESSEIKLNKAINLSNIRFSYLNRETLFDKLNLEIKSGECVGIIGKNGSGKSTLLDLITGIIEPNNGEVLVDKINIKQNINDWQSRILFMSQKHYLFEDSILANILLGEDQNNYDKNKFDFAIKISNLGKFLDNLLEKKETIIGSNNKNLSGGQQKKVHIARCFYRFNENKDLIILDEPFENLDEESKSIFLEQIKKIRNNCALIIISHDKKDLDICDKIFDLESKTFKNI